MSLFNLVQRQHLATCPLHWQSEKSGQNHSTSPRCHSGQGSCVQCTFEETNCVLIIQPPHHHPSHSTYIWGLALFHSDDCLSRANPCEASLTMLLQYGNLSCLPITIFVQIASKSVIFDSLLASSCSELPHMQQPIRPKTSRKGIAQHRRSSKTCCFSY